MNSTAANTILKKLEAGDTSAFEELPSEERRLIEYIVKEIHSEGNSKALEQLWETDYRRRPVSIDRFLDDPYYLGEIGKSIFPKWRDELRKIFDPRNNISELIIRGCVGAGKTSIAVIAMLYKIHQLVCMKNPQNYFGLIDRSPIVFGLFNITKLLAKATAFQYLVEWTRLSRFFMEYQDKDADYLRKGFIEYPNNIKIALGASAIHALGQNIFGGLCDEADMGRVKSVTGEDIEQVADSYSQVRSRMDSRFLQKGGENPGLLILASQVRGRDAFLEKHSAKMQGDPNTYVISYALWEIQDWKFDLTKTFPIVIGDQKTNSYIPEEGVSIPPHLRVVDVPQSLKNRFEYDIDTAIRDIAGIPTHGSDLFLPRRDKLYECYNLAKDRLHPFSIDTVTLSIETDDDTSIVDSFMKERCMRQHDKAKGNWLPKWYAGVDRALHVDLSKNKDATGISMGCIGDVRDITRFDEDERPYRTRDYSIFIDFVLQIRAAKGSEIDFSKIRGFIYYLHHIGFPIRWVSFDGFQSTDSLQQLKKAGYDSKLITVDRKPDRYNYLKTTIQETRLDMYEYEPFTYEITRLQDLTLLKKKPPINHPPSGSKDTSDAVCGVTARLLEEKGLLAPSMEGKLLQDKIDGAFAREDKETQVLRDFSNPRWLGVDITKGNPSEHLEALFEEEEEEE